MMTTHITTQSQLTKIPLIEMRNVCVLFPDGSARIKYPYLNLSYIYAYRRVWEFNGHFVSVAYVVELVSSHMSHTQRTYVRNGPNFKFCLTLRPFSTLEDQSIFKTVRSTVYILDLQLRCMCVICRIPTRCIHTNEARCLRAINKFRVFDILTCNKCKAHCNDGRSHHDQNRTTEHAQSQKNVNEWYWRMAYGGSPIQAR